MLHLDTSLNQAEIMLEKASVGNFVCKKRASFSV